MMAFWMKDKKNIALLTLSLLSAALLGLLLMSPKNSTAAPSSNLDHPTQAQKTTWTCSMHPSIQQPAPGLCPLCGMDLIPLSNEEGGDGGPWSLKLSEHARALAEIETAEVTRKDIAHEVRMVGKVAFDEKRVSNITAWVSGRIDRLFVDFTGIEVRQGDHMVELYSPDLISAQQELRQALRSVKSGPASLRKASESRRKAARRKLALLGLSNKQIMAIENSEQTNDRLTIESPIAGIVIEKHLNEGAYVTTGSPIYTVVDLSRVWIILDAYESDLTWLRYGQEVEFEIEAVPGAPFTGRIVFIDPVLNPRTRTVKVRIDVPNPQRKLKPDMFVRAVAKAVVSSDGKVMDPALAGKWICPMHQEVVADRRGSCDVCGMALVQAEDLGFVAESGREPPLVVPASAVLITGERAVVYVESPGQPGRYQGREISLGPEGGDFYVVRSGLEEGERVVVNGAFKIDSELQIRAKYSMMYHPSEPEAAPESTPFVTQAAFRESLDRVYQAYFQIQDHLSQDTLAPAQAASRKARDAMANVATKLLQDEAIDAWTSSKNSLAQHLEAFEKASEISAGRSIFEQISAGYYRLAQQFGHSENTVLLRFHCPMAFDNRGADWLQNHGGTANPYFGASMFACGSQVEDLGKSLTQETKTKAANEKPHDH